MIHLVTCKQPHFSLTNLSERGDGIDNVYQTNTAACEVLCYVLRGAEQKEYSNPLRAVQLGS